MTRRHRPWLLVALLGASACGPASPPPGHDDAADSDPAVDASADALAAPVDAPATDATAGDAGPPDERVYSHPCASDRLINLDTAGTTVSPRRTRYIGSNADTPASNAFSSYFTCSRPGHEVAFAYSIRGNSRLRISTNNPGTADDLDTIVFAMGDPDQLSPTAPTECQRYGRMGCNDNEARDVVAAAGPRAGASTLLARGDFPIGRGGTVVIVVAGYTPASAGHAATGTFELTVDEVDVPLGGACDPGISICASGSGCVTRGAASTCVAAGGEGASCRPSVDSACDAGLSCAPDRVCRPTASVGESCDPRYVANQCVNESTCVARDGVWRCVADGARGGACRSSGSSCDSGLACSATRVCLPLIADGAACDPSGAANLCGATSSCLAGGAGSACYASGSPGGRCRASDPPCDAGLACDALPANTDSRCRPARALNDPCDPARLADACTAPASCVPGGAGPVCAVVGYTESTLSAPVFLDACRAGAHLTIAGASRDDAHASAAVALPFAFSFFREAQTSLWPSTNGYAVFGAQPPVDVFLGAIPVTDEHALIAPYLDDLALRPGPASDLCAATFGAAPARAFVLEWLDAQIRADGATHLTFEVVLNESTNSVDFVYGTLTAVDSAHASVGLQNATGLASAAHGGAVATTAGLRWTPLP